MAARDQDEAIARALAAWARRVADGSPRTARTYDREATALLAFLQKQYGPGLGCLLEALPSDCLAFVHATPDLAPASRAVKASVLRGLFGALVIEGLRPTNPAAEIRTKNVASGNHHPAVPQSAAITALDRLRESDEPRDIGDRALCLLALAVGARRFELAALDVRSIERDDKHAAAVEFTGKGGKSVRMTIKRGVLEAIDRWLAVAELTDKPDSPLFTSLSHRPEHAGKRLTGDGIRFIIKRIFPRHSPHGLRARAVADIWSQSGANLGHAQAFARHSSPAVTEKVYIQAEKLEHALKHTYDYA